MCGDLLNDFLQESFPSQSLVPGYVYEFVCRQPQIIRAVSANNDAVPRRQTVVSAERGKGRSFRRSSFEVRPTRIDINSLRLEEKAASAILRSDLGFDRCTFLLEGVSIWRQQLCTY